jgi:oxygen-independent coproporphyrinogen III oxidase
LCWCPAADLRWVKVGRHKVGTVLAMEHTTLSRDTPWTEALVRDARELGFDSVNVDLIYGLPRQTPESFERTVRQVALLRPDRIALYGYAHLPARFKPQRCIVSADLPSATDRLGMLGQALAGFVGHGYPYIGMDHFALPGDSLAQAKRQGRLHRNFQGYSTQPDCDLIGLGVSAISRIGAICAPTAAGSGFPG